MNSENLQPNAEQPDVAELSNCEQIVAKELLKHPEWKTIAFVTSEQDSMIARTKSAKRLWAVPWLPAYLMKKAT